MSYFDTLKELRRKFYGENDTPGLDKVVSTAQTSRGIFERPTEVKRGMPKAETPEPETSESYAEFAARMQSYSRQARERMMSADISAQPTQRSYRPQAKPEENLGVKQRPVGELKLERSADTATAPKTQAEQLQALRTTATFAKAFTPADVLADEPFMREVSRVSKRFGINENDLLAIINFETGGTFDPGIRNPQKGSTATGLIQFVSKTARGLGTSVEELAQMSRAEQMTYVEKHLATFGRRANGATLEDLYMLVLHPVSAGKPSDTPLFVRGSQNYEKNRGLDVNNDGVITKAEATERVRRRAGLMERRA